MRKTLAEKYEKETPVGVYSVSNGYAYLIFDLCEEDKGEVDREYVVCSCSDAGRTRYRRTGVHYSKSGRPYIYRDQRKIYLDEVMRYAFPRLV